MAKLFYISFATDEGFFGATVVAGEDEIDAIATATILRLNPGGEAAVLEVPDDLTREDRVEMLSYRNRLVSKEELVRHGAKRLTDLSNEMQGAYEEACTVVCKECNQPNATLRKPS
jgi:hypothetical protein